jgi:predicted phosphodiesterase
LLTGPSVLSSVYINITGCKEDGECKPVGSVWRRPGECAKFKCVMGDCDDGSIVSTENGKLTNGKYRLLPCHKFQ